VQGHDRASHTTFIGHDQDKHANKPENNQFSHGEPHNSAGRVETTKGADMGLFSKRPSTITFAPGVVNVDAQAATSGSADMTLDAAKRILRLDAGQDLRDENIWRVRSDNCAKLQGNGYWAGILKAKGAGVGIYVGGKHVGNVDARGTQSAMQMIKAHGGKQATCVVSQTSQASWNVYVNMQ
jgi:hypothetical protein